MKAPEISRVRWILLVVLAVLIGASPVPVFAQAKKAPKIDIKASS
jgi:hypothetical protein